MLVHVVEPVLRAVTMTRAGVLGGTDPGAWSMVSVALSNAVPAGGVTATNWRGENARLLPADVARRYESVYVPPCAGAFSVKTHVTSSPGMTGAAAVPS